MCRLVQFDQDKYVAEIKLRHIQNIAEQASKTKGIDRIMLFGSSIEERCTATSDIDIAVFGKLSKAKYIDSKEYKSFQNGIFRFDWDQNYDILYFPESAKASDLILRDINHGVEIYRRAGE